MKIAVIDSLQKIMPNVKELNSNITYPIQCLKNEKFSFQVAYSLDAKYEALFLEVESDIKEFIKIQEVVQVPGHYVCAPDVVDDYYIRKDSGLFPDYLFEYDERAGLSVIPNSYQSVWVTLELPKDYDKTEESIIFNFYDSGNKLLGSEKCEIKINDISLEKTNFIHTEWFHVDAIINYYKVAPFTDEFWQAIQNYFEKAYEFGVNTIFTPLFTPSLDIRPGKERLTFQLVEISLKDGVYKFNFEKLKKWIEVSKQSGFEYFEMAHFFTQWGADHVTKIFVEEEGVLKKKFNYDTDIKSNEFVEFFEIFANELDAFFIDEGIKDKVFLHVADEPPLEKIESYKYVSCLVKNNFKGYKTIDALSDYEFYEQGLVECPVVSTDAIETFLENKVSNIWSYYCVGQKDYVSNRFLAVPSNKTRIIGVQWYYYQIKGFLHWGYNFFNSIFSAIPINPLLSTDSKCGFPAGDAFLVYPGDDLKPVESIRLYLMKEALQDYELLCLLEKKIGRGNVIDLIDEIFGEFTFKVYPKDEGQKLLELRNEAISLITEETVACFK
ncbi:MAG: DUF4091 domain-containing protein [Peptostreptococcaceae bacterium]